MTESALLHCPVRGALKVSQRATDRLTFTEEKHRIDAVRYLLQRQYPKDHFGIETVLFRLGRDGRNSFRADFAVYDEPFDDLKGKTLPQRLDHLRLLAEVKRDNADAARSKETQVKGALRQVESHTALGVYWDDVEQRFFYKQVEQKRTVTLEAPISKIPLWGTEVGSTRLFYSDLKPANDLIKIFDEIEDAMHAYVADKAARYVVIQQILLAKIHDENMHRGQKVISPLAIQDFSVEAASDDAVMTQLNAALAKAAGHYNLYLPSGAKVETQIQCPVEALRHITRILSPVDILNSRSQIIQSFYMKFAMNRYKWDLAQYFTPHEVIDFIVDLTNPSSGEHIHDPACGSADFLVSAFRRIGPSAQNSVWGVDNSQQAVQISIVNMVLNGDGKTSIKVGDSLKDYAPNGTQFSVVLCNPPFGTKIVERRFEVIRKFDLGYKWEWNQSGQFARTEQVKPTQQTGILFTELCTRLALPGGRVGIILPNGYLGNSSAEYLALREWLLRHTRIVAIIALPRFTFKKSGADVSASVVVLEKRQTPLSSSKQADDHSFYVGNIESVGWRAGDKAAVPVYLRDENDGSLLLDELNEPRLDADFESTLRDFLLSPASSDLNWVSNGRELPNGPQSWHVSIEKISADPKLNLDPKRHSFKFNELRANIMNGPHIRLKDVLMPVPTQKFEVINSAVYNYVEIDSVGYGDYDHVSQRGWELPSRAKLRPEYGDVFIAHLWSSAGKWFIAAGEIDSLVVTNGFAQLRFLSEEAREEHLVDLAIGFSSEAFRVQLRALSTGSDGLAEISDDDLLEIVLPKVSDKAVRKSVQVHIDQALAGQASLAQTIRSAIQSAPNYPTPPNRKSHCALV